MILTANNHEFTSTTSFREISIADRVASLVKQTAEIVIQKSKQVGNDIVAITVTKHAAMKQKYFDMRQQTCQSLWAVTVALLEEQKKLDEVSSGFCFDAGIVPLPTLRERVFCGPVPDFPVCDDELSEDYGFDNHRHEENPSSQRKSSHDVDEQHAPDLQRLQYHKSNAMSEFTR